MVLRYVTIKSSTFQLSERRSFYNHILILKNKKPEIGSFLTRYSPIC